MYDISFCVKRKELNNEEYNKVLNYMFKMSHKEYNDGDVVEDVRMTSTYIFGTIDRDDALYKYLICRDIDGLEWNE